MDIRRCPGQDRSTWTPDDIFELGCPHCGASIEFFKDDTVRRCRGCGQAVPNPRFDMGCAQWCAASEQCSIMRGVVREE